jgi:hypothetical protein
MFRVCCDFCGRALKIMTIDTENGPVEALEAFRTKNVNTRRLYHHLCEHCATGLDEVVRLAKEEWIKQIDISSRNAAINSARREALGTKG